MVTAVAFVATTVSAEELPCTTELGLATIVTVGAGAGAAATVTETTEDAFPPLPVALAVYVVVADGVTFCEPPMPGML
jgi:hypothetical protein